MIPRSTLRGERRRQDPRSLVACAALALVLSLPALLPASEPPIVPASEAHRYVGQVARVCGRVESASYIGSVRGTPTFLNLGRPYPDQDFTVVIWGSNRGRFERPPERMYDGREICVTGEIETYRGRPQIEARSPDQIELVGGGGAHGEVTDTEAVLVKALLAHLGFDVNYGSAVWDQDAVEAAIAFQERQGLEPTGDPDAPTLRALANAVPGLPEGDAQMVIRLLLFEIVRRWE